MLRIRTQAERIGELLPLAGVFLNVGGHEVCLGVPRVRALMPALVLMSRLVTIKGFTEPEPFLEAAGRQLEALGISGRASIPPVSGGPRAGLLQRRVLRIKGVSIVGFALVIEDLTPEGSERLLVHGLGGRRHMGCGIFVPVRSTGGRR
ncbi:MAG: type I-MYXAN CRISPR-associated protein Cas6/Cmx6 [Isosphaeraceae bacterium]|nr:type I-MYXAN CRISPR-associated protein Cas6/Cmx6 [Isosphaeraceae bacterium]